MPETNGINKEPPDKRRFMREKIEKQPLTRRQLAARVAIMLFLAALCGAVAAISFVFMKNITSGYVEKDETVETTPVVFTKDEPEALTSEVPSTESPEELAREEQRMEDRLSKAFQEYSFSASDFAAMHKGIQSLAGELDQGIVTVHSETQQMDWFGNPVERTDQSAGVIIAKTGTEVLIFTGVSAVSDTEAIEVVFSNGQAAAATIKQTDEVVGVAVISVDKEALEKETLDNLAVVELGNSYSVKQGDLVLAAGSPAGMVHSTNYGVISYVARNVQMVDGTTRVFYTDMAGNAESGTFIFNTDGRMIGWVTDDFKNENSQDMTAIFGISDYKPALERLTNGRGIAYFGVRGQEVSQVMTEQGMPAGVYVADAIAGGPAYNAGIQNGDIITGIGEKEIASVKELQTQLENMESGQEVLVKIRRQSREEYKELEYHVNIRAR